MSTQVQTIIDGAYNRATDNDPGKLAQDGELIAHLSRVYERAWPLVARARPDEFNTQSSATLTGVPPRLSLPLDLIALLGVYTAGGNPVWVSATTDRTRLWNLAPSMYRQGLTLVSRNLTGDPLAGDLLTLVILDAPAPLVYLTDTLDARWPVRHVQLLVDVLAVYLSVKDAGRDAGDRAAIGAELQQSVAAFAAEYGLAPADVAWIHADAETGKA
jgi:hypothetical protein